MSNAFEDLDYIKRYTRTLFSGSLSLLYNDAEDAWDFSIEWWEKLENKYELEPHYLSLGSYPARMTYETMFRLARNRLEAIRKEQEDE